MSGTRQVKANDAILSIGNNYKIWKYQKTKNPAN